MVLKGLWWWWTVVAVFVATLDVCCSVLPWIVIDGVRLSYMTSDELMTKEAVRKEITTDLSAAVELLYKAIEPKDGKQKTGTELEVDKGSNEVFELVTKDLLGEGGFLWRKSIRIDNQYILIFVQHYPSMWKDGVCKPVMEEGKKTGKLITDYLMEHPEVVEIIAVCPNEDSERERKEASVDMVEGKKAEKEEGNAVGVDESEQIINAKGGSVEIGVYITKSLISFGRMNLHGEEKIRLTVGPRREEGSISLNKLYTEKLPFLVRNLLKTVAEDEFETGRECTWSTRDRMQASYNVKSEEEEAMVAAEGPLKSLAMDILYHMFYAALQGISNKSNIPILVSYGPFELDIGARRWEKKMRYTGFEYYG